ncbi:phage polarity suppression protein, partial [Salmonella enterica subsp. enterica]|nr:phage polarity suppression protein [Salmonella enterica subsp. enterica]
QLEDLRERLAVLEWQINCAARDGLYAHQIVLESCVTSATENFMSEHGDALTDALAPFLCAPYGLEAAMKILRTAVARQTEVRTPVISAAYKSIIDETGLTVDASMCADASASFTPAQHKVFLARLNRLNEKGGY